MRILIELIFYDIFLATFHLASDILLVYSYFHGDDPWWGGITILAICLPGLLEMMVFLYMYLHNDLPGTNSQQLKELLFWSFLFGPLLFPVSLIIWHGYQLYHGEASFLRFENMARSRVLNSLSVLTKSALQLVLQTSVMMITWDHNQVWLNIFRVSNVTLSLIVLAKSATDHHYFVSSGKNPHAEKEVKLSRRLLRLMFNIAHVLIRGFVISLLACYLHFITIIFIVLMIVSNYILALLTVSSTDGSKHLLTACGSVLLPKCFVSRATLENKPAQYGARMFERYYRLNSLVFFLVFSILGLITANCVIRWTDINKFTCDNLPFLSDAPECEAAHQAPTHLDPSHDLFYMLGNLLLVLTSVMHVILVLLQEAVIGDTADLPV